MTRLLFEVELTRTESGTLLVWGESEGEVVKAVRQDFNEHGRSYDLEKSEVAISAWKLAPQPSPGSPMLADGDWVIIDGKVRDVRDYVNEHGTVNTDEAVPQPVVDTVTLPLPFETDVGPCGAGLEKCTDGFEHLGPKKQY